MRVKADMKIKFDGAAAQQWGEAFTTECAAMFGEQVLARARHNVTPGVGPGPHPHVTQHVDTGRLLESLMADIAKTSNGVKVTVFTDVPYGVFLEAGWHTQSGRFVRYPWLRPAVDETGRDFATIVNYAARVGFAGGPRGGTIRIRRDANVWDTYIRGWRNAT